ncbi:MAG: 4Fe-4S dicluster domain-containing protein [Planctomycetes bacterium]|nr:4Fe-4S dicluster domain-containing protein [Planctomycetota bacterium]
MDYERYLDCIHCGLCLPSCPTYAQEGLEAGSPRGRVHLLRALADGRIEAGSPVTRHLDSCLVCRGCETACPSGVQFGRLMEDYRSRAAAQRQPERLRRLVDRVVFAGLFSHPRRLAPVFGALRLYQETGAQALGRGLGLTRLLPGRLRVLEGLLPRLPRPGPALPERTRPRGRRRLRVGLLAGCVARYVAGDVNHATVRALARAGCEVLVAPGQTCCGALHAHAGFLETAREMAVRNVEAFRGVDRVVTNAAGCGAMLKEYGHLLEGGPHAAQAADLVARARDVHQVLVELDARLPRHARLEARVAYHDACHLAHGQGVRREPREILSRIGGLELVPLEESDLCCGSAGVYNVTHPAQALGLGWRKLDRIAASGARVVAAANPGCVLQIASLARRRGMDLEVVHPVLLWERAARSRKR